MRCSYCWDHGHNRRGCPSRKEKVKKLIAEGRKDHWLVEQDEKYKQKGKRKCSYCDGTGHNIRTCSEKKEDIDVLEKAEPLWKKALYEKYKELYPGFGMGALVSQPRLVWQDGSWTHKKLIYMIIGMPQEHGELNYGWLHRREYGHAGGKPLFETTIVNHEPTGHLQNHIYNGSELLVPELPSLYKSSNTRYHLRHVLKDKEAPLWEIVTPCVDGGLELLFEDFLKSDVSDYSKCDKWDIKNSVRQFFAPGNEAHPEYPSWFDKG